jgi:signal transduction histidine kinase
MKANILFISNDFKTVFNPILGSNEVTFNLEILNDEEYYINDEELNKFLEKNNVEQSDNLFSNEYNGVIYYTIISDKIKGFTLSYAEYLMSIDDTEIPHIKKINRMLKESTLLKPEMFKGLGDLTINRIDFFKNQLEKAVNIEDDQAKIKRLEKIARKQQEILTLMVTDEERIFSLIGQFNNYRSLAMRGLSFMAGGHEMCGIFQRLQSLLKRKGDEFKSYLNDFNRLEEIFIGQVGIHGSPIQGYNPFNGKHLTEYCSNVFGERRNKEIIFSEDIHNYKAEHPLNRQVALTVLSNLIRNALSFSDKVEVKWVDDLIIVSDDGAGVASEDVSKLFSAGFTKRSGGHGLGLLLCKEKALEHKCSLYFDPDNKHTELKGASFIFDLNGKYEYKK